MQTRRFNFIFSLSLILFSCFAFAQNFRMMGINDAPKTIVLPVQINDQGFARNLHAIVEQINRVDGLQGDDQISMLGWLANEDQTKLELLDPVKNLIVSSAEIAKSLQDLPLLKIVKSEGNSNFAFFQDAMEILAPTDNGPMVLLNLLGSEMQAHGPIVSAVSSQLNLTNIPGHVTAEDDDGGNVEVTPDGIPYLGSTSSTNLRDQIKSLTGQDPIILPTEWLFVGHVDEMLTFLPTQTECGSTLLYADPLEALNFMRETGQTPLIPREDIEGIGASIRNPEHFQSAFMKSLKYFTRRSSRTKTILTLDDFDTKKPVRDLVKNPEQMDIEFLGNLNAHVQIQSAVASLQRSRPAKCQTSVAGLPSWYYSRKGVSFDLSQAQTEIRHGYTAVAGYINLISLRRHVIIASEPTRGFYVTLDEDLVEVKRPEEGFFGPAVRSRLESLLGGENFVHTIGMEYYERGAGSAHCVTNVIRSSAKWQ